MYALTPNKSRACRCEGCVSNLSQVRIKCFCNDKRCIAFPHSITLLTFCFTLIVWKVRHWKADLNIWYICCLCHMIQRLQIFLDKVKLAVKSVWKKEWKTVTYFFQVTSVRVKPVLSHCFWRRRHQIKTFHYTEHAIGKQTRFAFRLSLNRLNMI